MNQIKLKQLLWYDKHTGIFRWRHERKYGLIKPWSEAGWNDGGYTRIQIGAKPYLAHRLAWLYEYSEWPSQDVDHINGSRSDNRICNLRDVARQTNAQNRREAPKGSVSKILGVSPYRNTGRWVAGIYTQGKRKHLGVFDTAEQAQAAYLDAKRQLHKGCTV